MVEGRGCDAGVAILEGFRGIKCRGNSNVKAGNATI
jgi:hypothetical protein